MALIKLNNRSSEDNAIHGRRNLIINGAMQVAQRGTSKTATSAATYLLDRFMAYAGNYSNYGYTVSQTTDAPTGFSNSLKYNFDDADTSPATEHSIYYRFEGQDLQNLKKGTASAESVTLSFWCKASLAGTYIVELMDVDNSNRHINKSYSISSANTWEHKTITFEGDTTGTLTNDNSTSLDIAFWLAANSSNTSGTLQTSWGAISQANRAVGQTNLGATVNNAFYITGVQLEVGTTTTPFEHRSYAEELSLCQRYYLLYVGDQSNAMVGVGDFWSATQVSAVMQFPTTMRATPSMITENGGTNYYSAYSNSIEHTVSNAWTLFLPHKNGASIYVTPNTNGTAGNAARIRTNVTSAYMAFDSEL